MRLLMVLGLLLATVTPSFAWNEPDGFGGVKWGATQEEALAALKEESPGPRRSPVTCAPGRDRGGSYTACTTAILLGTSMVPGNFRFDDRGFFMAYGLFPSRDYEAMRDVFVKTYGDPTARSQREFATPKGPVTHEGLTWFGEKVIIRLNRFTARPTEGSFEIVTRAEEERRAERRREIRKGPGVLQ